MNTKSKYKSEAFEAIHQSASALLKIEAITQKTMRNFDAACLVTTEIPPEKIKEIREKNKDVKNYLNVARKRVPSCDCLMLSSFSFYEITKETEKVIFDLHVLHDEQREKLRDLRNKIRAIVNSARTVEQFCKDYPEFANYAKQEDEHVKNLPSTNLIAEMKKIGWESK